MLVMTLFSGDYWCCPVHHNQVSLHAVTHWQCATSATCSSVVIWQDTSVAVLPVSSAVLTVCCMRTDSGNYCYQWRPTKLLDHGIVGPWNSWDRVPVFVSHHSSTCYSTVICGNHRYIMVTNVIVFALHYFACPLLAYYSTMCPGSLV